LSRNVRSAPHGGPESAVAPRPQRPAHESLPTRGLPTLVDRDFGREDIAVVRHEVSRGLVAAGLADDRLHGFVLAVNEVVTNVALHAGGHGRVALWLSGGSAWCAVSDFGPGIPSRYLSSPEVPEAFETGGRGIWLAYQLCDEVTMATGPGGTTIGLRIGLPRRPSPA
jgi:anti-sigma regulatory factor (Ser/Thr protein kinase)